MSVDIALQIDEPFLDRVEPDRLEKAIASTVQRFGPTDDPTITMVITDSDTVQELNRRYRNIDTPTDVLSFANPSDPDFPNLDHHHLGDVIIAYPIAQDQALASGHTPMEELILLAVHGTLHLLEFDHDTLPHKKEMWAAQQEIMAGLGLAHIQPEED